MELLIGIALGIVVCLLVVGAFFSMLGNKPSYFTLCVAGIVVILLVAVYQTIGAGF